MSEVVTIKVTSKTQRHFKNIVKILETQFKIFYSSQSIFDKSTGNYHIFLSCEER